MSLYYEDLERLSAEGCQCEGCTEEHVHEFFFHARCHPSAGTWVSYSRGMLDVPDWCPLLRGDQ